MADPAGQHVVVFGAGGAARAIAVEAALAGAAQLTVVNRDGQRAAELAAIVNERTAARAQALAWQGTYRVPQDMGIVVNATSIGLAPHVDARLALDASSLRPRMVVADVIPNPPRAALISRPPRRAAASCSMAWACWSIRP